MIRLATRTPDYLVWRLAFNGSTRTRVLPRARSQLSSQPSERGYYFEADVSLLSDVCGWSVQA